MQKLARLLALVFLCAIVLSSTTVFAGGDGSKGRLDFGGKSEAGCSGSCYPGSSNCVNNCECSGQLSCCTAGCNWCCSQTLEQ